MTNWITVSRVGRLSLFCSIGFILSCADKTPQKTQPPSVSGPAVIESEPNPPSLPNLKDQPVPLQKRLRSAREALGADYQPRTKHKSDDGRARFTNRLLLEKSPYLRQHAHNPVNWFSWSDEAFELAKRLDRPVFLSIGYSTCHWCHVMEEQSFEDLEIAQFLNEHFVSIKVDRERRPDVDNIYMKAVRVLSGGGGWPMTVFLTPEREPFFAGNYFPPRSGMRGRPGFLGILKDMSTKFRDQRETIIAKASEVSERIRRSTQGSRPGGILGAQTLVHGARSYASSFDPAHGGFGRAPKFPRPASLDFLLHYFRRTDDPGALQMVTKTLLAMHAGGMYDHVGGGFHRYSTDARWLVPHFEKMLYDNAQLVNVYLDAYKITSDERFARIAREILTYVAREMIASNGGFYSATDADSLNLAGHREEGFYFTWTPEELKSSLSGEELRFVEATHPMTSQGNFEGRNILFLSRPYTEVATDLNTDVETLLKVLAGAYRKLDEIRKRRPLPILDDKLLAGWNGLMISAFARGGFDLREPRFISIARNAATFWKTAVDGDGRLFRVHHEGGFSHDGVLDDYSYLSCGLLDLFEATQETQWLELAMTLHRTLDERFWDSQDGGFFYADRDTTDLLTREKPDYDGARPSGNSVGIQNLLRLHEWTSKPIYRTRSESALKAFSNSLRRVMAVPRLAAALDYYWDQPKQIVLVSPDSQTPPTAFLDVLARTYLPNRVLVATSQDQTEKLGELVPMANKKVARNGQVTAYVCYEGICKLPTTDPAVFAKQIGEVFGLPGVKPKPLELKAAP
jgi:uncharacterized protein